MPTVTLTEHSTSDAFLLSGDERQALLDLPPGRVGLLATADPEQVQLRATSWVGAIVLPSVTIRITPRVGMANLFTMFSAGVPSGSFTQDQLGWAGDHELVDGVAAFLLRAIDSCTRRGLLHGYLHREEQLQVIRGRLLVDQLALRPWSSANPPCGYDDFTIDVPENRPLAGAVAQLLRWSALPSLLRRDALQLAARFEGVSVGSAEDSRGAVAITALNQHYEAALDLAAQALEGLTISHDAGEHRADAFLIDLQDLFRRWVGVELRARLWPQFQLDEQPALALDLEGRLAVRPDLLVAYRDRPALVIQTRHRLTDDSASPDTTLRDTGSSVEVMYPVLMQAAALQTPAALLVFADADQMPAPEVDIRGIDTRLLSVHLSLAATPEVLVQRLDDLADLVRSLSRP